MCVGVGRKVRKRGTEERKRGGWDDVTRKGGRVNSASKLLKCSWPG